MLKTLRYNKTKLNPKLNPAFTIIELLIVIVIIAILVAIVTVSYNGITKQAKEVSLKSDLKNAFTQLQLDKIESNTFPSNADSLKTSQGNTFAYTVKDGGEEFCLTATNAQANLTFSITQDGKITEGDCPTPLIQSFSNATCPTERTMVMDARDKRTYWIQKIGSNCWMTTNLAYAGGGDNTYSDTIPTGNGTTGLHGPDNSGANTYTEAKYYIPTGANPTTNPTPPSTSTDGTGQYGYLYNWCAAMGNQQGTSACMNADTPLPNTTTSICPKNWRLPTQSPTNEFLNLNKTVNGGKTNTDAGLIASPWLGQRSGYWSSGSFSLQGTYGSYWSSTQNSATIARDLVFSSSNVSPSNINYKSSGRAVRCVAE